MYRRNRCMDETTELLRLSLRESVRDRSPAAPDEARGVPDREEWLRTAVSALGAALSAAALSYPLWG
jgi:hypothetical protein